jgi:hypothetical protein
LRDVARLTTPHREGSGVRWSKDERSLRNMHIYIFVCTDLGVPGSIFGATRFSDKCWVPYGGPISLVKITEELLRRNSSGSGVENRD